MKQLPDVAAYASKKTAIPRLTDDPFPEQFAKVCAEVDNRVLTPDRYRFIADDLAATLDPAQTGTAKTKLGNRVLAAVLQGCWKTGHATKWTYNQESYGQDGDLMAALHKAGFDDYLAQVATPAQHATESCDNLTDLEALFPEDSERQEWVSELTKPAENGIRWNEQRANKFVDVLFRACYDSGRALDPNADWEPEEEAAEPVAAGKPFGDGTWRVGDDIEPGIYWVQSAKLTCSWYRLNTLTSSFGQEYINDVGVSERGEQVFVSIEASDVAFRSIGCGTWKPYD